MVEGIALSLTTELIMARLCGTTLGLTSLLIVCSGISVARDPDLIRAFLLFVGSSQEHPRAFWVQQFRDIGFVLFKFYYVTLIFSGCLSVTPIFRNLF